jgi:hypothetical protein
MESAINRLVVMNQIDPSCSSPSQDVLPSRDVLRPAGQGWQVGLLVVLPVSMEASV